MRGSKHTLAQALHIRDNEKANLSLVLKDMPESDPHASIQWNDGFTDMTAFPSPKGTSCNGIKHVSDAEVRTGVRLLANDGKRPADPFAGRHDPRMSRVMEGECIDGSGEGRLLLYCLDVGL